tara:strand:+ start:1535 stop:2077 length:543 start_codon:yes stop_codon:yes gene_type:complete
MANDPTKPSEDAVGPEASVKKGLPQKLVSLIAIIRAKLRDHPELNRLIVGRETSDREIALAIMEAIDDFNTTPPLIGSYSVEDFPSVSLLIRGSLISVLESVGLLQTRNQMSYSDGQGVQVSVSDKTPMLMNWINLYVSQYENKKVRLKKALNLSGALNGTGVPSEYLYVNGDFDDLDLT